MSRDLGIDLVKTFHKVFNCVIGNPDNPEVPSAEQKSIEMISAYHQASKNLGEMLKSHAADAKERGDENGALLLIRLQLIQEELAELAEAMKDGDIVSSFDALVDLSYVIDGTYITLGLHEVKELGLMEVHRSNMSKLDYDGAPIIAESGRVVKGPLYRKPNLKPILLLDK